MIARLGIAAICAGISLAGCNYNENKLAAADVGTLEACSAPADFASVQKKVLKPYCVSCHGNANASRGVNVETLAGVKAHLGRVQGQIASGAMPPGGAMPAGLKAYALNWLQAGAPETAAQAAATGGGCKGAEQAVSELCDVPPSFAIVQRDVLRPRCFECHRGEAKRGGGVDLSTYTAILARIGDVQKSVEVRSMPPEGGLKTFERNLMLRWIEAGAPDTVSGPPKSANCPNLFPVPATYASVHNAVFKPRCVVCHGKKGGVNLESYENVLANLPLVQSEVEADSMPKEIPLTDQEKRYVLNWIRAGAPK